MEINWEKRRARKELGFVDAKGISDRNKTSTLSKGACQMM